MGRGLDPAETRELQWFCAQYRRKKAEAAALLTLRVSTPEPETYSVKRLRRIGGKLTEESVKFGTFQPRGRGVPGDPVADAARKREKYLRDVDMIDRAAMRAARAFATPGNRPEKLAQLLTAVVTGQESVTWALQRCSIGRNPFYDMRTAFFLCLKEEREDRG